MQAGSSSIWRNAIENKQLIAQVLCVTVAAIMIALELMPLLSAQHAPVAAKHASANSNQAAVNVEQITSADLFGHANIPTSNLPQTNLQLVLRAIFAADDPKLASAVIESGDGNAQIVKVGASIGSVATLQSVQSDRVVLSRNGVLETLFFPAPQESNLMSAAQNAAPPGNTESASASAAAQTDEIKRAAIMQRLEELRMRSAH